MKRRAVLTGLLAAPVAAIAVFDEEPALLPTIMPEFVVRDRIWAITAPQRVYWTFVGPEEHWAYDHDLDKWTRWAT